MKDPTMERALALAVPQPAAEVVLTPIGSAGAQLPPAPRAIDILLNPRAMDAAKMLSSSGLVPAAYRGKPADTLVAMAWGASLGLDVFQSLQGIAVINGKPTMWGDSLLALCRAHGADVEEIEASNGTWTCTVTRPGRKPVSRQFSVEDAKQAGLWGKSGTWQSYPQRMLQMRARGFALRDACADILLGLITREEAEDYPPEAEQRPDLNARSRIPASVGGDRVHVGGEATKGKAELPTHTRILMGKAKAMGWTVNGGREKGKEMLEALGFASLDAVPVADADRVAAALDLGPADWSYLHGEPPREDEFDSLRVFADSGKWSEADALRCLRNLKNVEDLYPAVEAGPDAWRAGGGSNA